MREVKPEPAATVAPVVRSAPTISSFAAVVVAAPLLGVALLPAAAATTSRGLAGSRPRYSRMRMSG